MGQNRIEKMAQRFAVDLPEEYGVRAGDRLNIRPLHLMIRDGRSTAQDTRRTHAEIEVFEGGHGTAIFDAGCGTGHQLMMEEGFVLPGTIVVAADPHANIYGALGALGTQVAQTDAASIRTTGHTQWQVPEVARVTLAGRLAHGVSGKDVILSLIGLFNQDEARNCAIEFEGEGIGSLSMDQRMTVACMTAEWGAVAGCFPNDGLTRAWLLYRAAEMMRRGDKAPRLTLELVESYGMDSPVPDPDAYYAKEFTLDLGTVTPVVAGPNDVRILTPLPQIAAKKIAVQKAYLLSCVNGRLEDIAEAAAVLRGRRVAPGVKLYMAAASRTVREEAMRLGYWDTLLESGAIELPPGCETCTGPGDGLLEPGEVGVSATGQFIEGRMGSPDSFVYLASPAVVAASAAEGCIASHAPVRTVPLSGSYEEHEAPARASGAGRLQRS